MNDKNKNQGPQIQFYKVMEGDTRDIGFKIRGYHFRWLNPKKQEVSLDRGWQPLTMKALPESIVKELSEKRPGFFDETGLVRRQEMTLGFMHEKEYAVARADLADRNSDARDRLTQTKTEGVMRTESSLENTDGFEIFEK